MNHILANNRWRMLHKFFRVPSSLRLVVATLKLHIKSKKPPRYVHTAFHLEKKKALTCAEEYVVTISNRNGVVYTLKDPVELWGQYSGVMLRTVTSTWLFHVGLELS